VRRFAAGVAAVLAIAGCSDDGALPEPSPTSAESTTSTTLFDFSGVPLEPVPGQTTTTLAQTGRSDVQGFVTGPQGGPIGGATVRIERLVFDSVATADLVTRPEDGGFDMPNVPGGRYRVRAFLPPTLAQVEPEVFFLEDGAQRKLDITLTEHSGLDVRASVAPAQPLLDEAVNLVVQVVNSVVDGNGIVRSQGVPGELVSLGGSSRWRLQSTNPVSTDGQGVARFELSCQSTGPPQLAVQLSGSGQVFELDLPDCVDPATLTTTTTAGEGGTTSTGGTTTTTAEDE
jgi:hypothetical protein